MTTIEQYLQGLFAYEFSESNMTSVLIKRDIEAGYDQADISTELKDLAQADLYMVLFNVFSQGNQTVSKGNWSRAFGSLNVGVYDRRAFMEAANAIYKKYGETTSASYRIKDGTNKW
jgi:hypothetical protein